MDANSKLYETLNQNYNSVELQDNGYYHCFNYSSGIECYVKADCPSDASMLSYLPGQGGAWDTGKDANQLREDMKSANPQFDVCVISSTSSNPNNVAERTTSVLNQAGIQIDNSTFLGFSAGVQNAFQDSSEYYANHPNCKIQVVLGDNDNIYNSDVQNCKNLAEAGIPIYAVGPSERKYSGKASRTIDLLSANGFNAYEITTESPVHTSINRDIVATGLIGYIGGNRNSVDNFTTNPKFDSTNWSVYEHENGVTKPVDLSVLSGTKPSNRKQSNNNSNNNNSNSNNNDGDNDYKFLLATENHEITEYDSEVKTKYAGLKNMSPLLISALHGGTSSSTFSSPTISSNLQFVETTMNSLRTAIQNSNFLDSLRGQTFRSSQGIPGCIGSYIDAYFDIVGTLMDSLALETESIVSYGQAIADMDMDLSRKADELSSIDSIVQKTTSPAAVGTSIASKQVSFGGNGSVVSNTSKTHTNNTGSASRSTYRSYGGGGYSTPSQSNASSEKAEQSNKQEVSQSLNKELTKKDDVNKTLKKNSVEVEHSKVIQNNKSSEIVKNENSNKENSGGVVSNNAIDNQKNNGNINNNKVVEDNVKKDILTNESKTDLNDSKKLNNQINDNASNDNTKHINDKNNNNFKDIALGLGVLGGAAYGGHYIVKKIKEKEDE